MPSTTMHVPVGAKLPWVHVIRAAANIAATLRLRRLTYWILGQQRVNIVVNGTVMRRGRMRVIGGELILEDDVTAR